LGCQWVARQPGRGGARPGRTCTTDCPCGQADGPSEPADLTPAGEGGSGSQRATRVHETERDWCAPPDHGQPAHRLRAELEPVTALELHGEHEPGQAVVIVTEPRFRPDDRLVPAIPAEEPGGRTTVETDGQREEAPIAQVERRAHPGPDGGACCPG